jgi:integrase
MSDAAAEWVALVTRRSTSKTLHYDYRSLLSRFAIRVNDCHTGSLTPAHVEDFFYGPGRSLSATCGQTTRVKHRSVMKRFFDWCHRRGYVALDGLAMVADIDKKGGRANRNRYRMTAPELVRLLDSADNPRDRALTAFVANTGVRISEALAMSVRDVSLPKGELYVKLIKTNEEVTLPVTLDLEGELQTWLRFYTEALGGLQPNFRLFPAYHRNRFVKGGGREPRNLNPTAEITNPRLVIQSMADRAGVELEPGDGWHTVRRSVARIVYEAAREHGHDDALRITQAALNHKRVETTEHYLGLDIERQRYADMMKGKPFLTAGIEPGKIVSLDDRRAARG